MPDSIQLGEYSTGGGTDGTSYNSSAFNQWNDERNVNVNRNDNDWNDNWWFVGVRNYPLLRMPAMLRAFGFSHNLPVPACELLARVLKRHREHCVFGRL